MKYVFKQSPPQGKPMPNNSDCPQQNFSNNDPNSGNASPQDDPLLFVRTELENLRGLVKSATDECCTSGPNGKILWELAFVFFGRINAG
jgi:hypothetical protein